MPAMRSTTPIASAAFTTRRTWTLRQRTGTTARSPATTPATAPGAAAAAGRLTARATLAPLTAPAAIARRRTAAATVPAIARGTAPAIAAATVRGTVRAIEARDGGPTGAQNSQPFAASGIRQQSDGPAVAPDFPPRSLSRPTAHQRNSWQISRTCRRLPRPGWHTRRAGCSGDPP